MMLALLLNNELWAISYDLEMLEDIDNPILGIDILGSMPRITLTWYSSVDL